ncbi:MAG: GNAT family N-acetyltransferase [Gemmatimonadota bacterium]
MPYRGERDDREDLAPRGEGTVGRRHSVRTLTPADAPQIVAVLADAFARYPVIRFVLDPEQRVDPRPLRRLLEFFVMARVHRGEALLGISDGSALVAVALASKPDSGPSPPELDGLRKEVWTELGPEARARYEAFGAATGDFEMDVPHRHLNMVGVRRAFQGIGLGRRLIDAAQELSRADPHSEGLSLTTEDPRNVAYYEGLGFRNTGYARVSPELETWGFFRGDTELEG